MLAAGLEQGTRSLMSVHVHMSRDTVSNHQSDNTYLQNWPAACSCRELHPVTVRYRGYAPCGTRMAGDGPPELSHPHSLAAYDSLGGIPSTSWSGRSNHAEHVPHGSSVTLRS